MSGENANNRFGGGDCSFARCRCQARDRDRARRLDPDAFFAQQLLLPESRVVVFNQKVREAEPGAKGKLAGILKSSVLVEVGGLLDGPVYRSIFANLKGIALFEPDEYAPFNTGHIVYHDDYGDYSTNEPIMDGTANLTYLLAAMGGKP